MASVAKQILRVRRLFWGTPAEKRKSWYNLSSTFASRFGFRMYGPQTSWFENQEFVDAWSHFPHKEGLVQDRRFNLYNLAKLISTVDGDLAECGVNVGRGSYLMLKANAATKKHLYGFDSFEGLSVPTNADEPADQRAQAWQPGEFAAAEELVRGNLQAFAGRFTLLKGWIPDRFEEVADKRFSLVHIDVDLYEPTRDSIGFFWPRLNAGGLIICDDYGSRRCPGARRAIEEFGVSRGLPIAELSTMQALLIKPAEADEVGCR